MKIHLLIHRFVRSRPRLSVATVLGILVGVLLPDSLSPLTRALSGWNVAVWLFLAAMGWMMMRADHRAVKVVARQQDESAAAVLTTLTIAAIASLTAIICELSAMKDLSEAERAMRYVYTIVTIFGSWFLVGTLFCVHYAHVYYQAEAEHLPLQFPNGECHPDYWDFLYFSFTIAVAAQTADVTILTRRMRRLVLGHSVLSFFFNLVILGLSINIAAGLING